MGIFTKVASAIGRVRFPGRAFVWFDFSRPDLKEIEESVGDGTASDVLMTPIRWLQRAIVEAPWQARDKKGEIVKDNDLIALLNTPNPFYTGDVLLAGTVLSLSLSGNAYWVVALNDSRMPVEIWYAPHTNVEPIWPSADNTKFITHYEYKIAGSTQKIRPLGADEEDIVENIEKGLAMIHFREGVDLDNLRLGLSPLKGLLREVWTDNEAAAFTASLLKNNGIPGIVISPADKNVTFTPEEGAVLKDKISTEFTGARRGKPLVMLGATKVEQFGFSPKEMDLSPLRNVSEERVTAALGVPAAVVGFGAGLQQTRVGATMKELRQLAWTNGVIPLQRRIANEVTRSLAPKFDNISVDFNNTVVEALRENQETKANRVERLVRAAILTRGEGRTELGFEAEKSDDIYLMSLAIVEVPRGQIASRESSDGKGEAKEHSSVERRIIDAAPSRKPTQVAALLANSLDRIRRSAGALLQDPLANVFESVGLRAMEAARAASFDGEGGAENDAAFVEEMLEDMDMAAVRTDLQEAMEQGYLAVARQVSSAIASTVGAATPPKSLKQPPVIEVDFIIPDAVQREVMRAGGIRAGLVDLDAQTRAALFDALESGRAAGLTADNLARHIRDTVAAGPWRDSATRARVIARTEGAHAANVSTLEAARAMPDTEHVQVFDDRIGFGDPDCIAANGAVVTIDEADAMGLAHPNCTRAFVPINALLMEEMGL